MSRRKPKFIVERRRLPPTRTRATKPKPRRVTIKTAPRPLEGAPRGFRQQAWPDHHGGPDDD